MRTKGSAEELERRRRLAVQRVLEGHKPVQVAQILGVHERTVRLWLANYRDVGDRGLDAQKHPGRPPKLPRQKQNLVLGWLRKNPKSFGFPTELWTARRVAEVIKRKFKVEYHPRYLNEWLTTHNFSPQKPERQPRERDDEAIRKWLRYNWPHIQNGLARRRPMCSSWTRAVS
jgi:transposase